MSTMKAIWSFIWVVISLEFVFALIISGCSIITPPTYHETEYSQFIDIADLASHGSCDHATTRTLRDLSNRAVLYSTFLPHNELMAEAASLMNKTINSLNQRANSPNSEQSLDDAYCRLKLSIITTMSLSLAEAAGGKTK